MICVNPEDVYNAATIWRKIAYCYLQMNLLAEAETECAKSIVMDPSDNSYFVMFLIKMADNNAQATEFLLKISLNDRPDIYIKAANYAFKYGKKTVLKFILKKVVTSAESIQWEKNEYYASLITVLRCLTRSMFEDIKALVSESMSEFSELYSLFEKSSKLLAMKEFPCKSDLYWFYKMAWNTSLLLVNNSESPVDLIVQFFLLTNQMIIAISDATSFELSSRKSCLFMAATAQMGLARSNYLLLDSIIRMLDEFKQVGRDLEEIDHSYRYNHDPLMIQAIVIEFECKARMSDWVAIDSIIKVSSS